MKLFQKTFVSVLIPFVVVISFVSYFVSIKQISDAERNVIEEHKTISRFLSKEIEVGYFESKWPFENLKQLATHDGFLFWWIVRDDGTIHLADNASFIGTHSKDYFPDITGGEGTEAIFLNRRQNYGIFVHRLETGKTKWSFWFGCSMKEISNRKKEIFFLTLAVSLSALVIFGAVLYFAMKRLIKPIKELSLGATSIGKGNLTYRIGIKSKDELGLLAHSFNKMAENLHEHQDKLLAEIAERKRAEEALQKSEMAANRLVQESASLAEIGEIISSSLNIEEVYERFAEEARKLIPLDGIAINIINYKEKAISIPYVSGIGVPGCQPGDILPLAGSLTGEVARTSSTTVVQTEDRNELQDRFPTLLKAFDTGFRSIMGVPLISGDKVIGAIHFRSIKLNTYSDQNLIRLAENIGSQIAGAVGNAQLFIELKRTEEAQKKLIRELEGALSQVKQLKGLLPICSYCRKVRDDKNYWQSVESYITEHSEAVFSHGVCPDCNKKYIQPQLEKLDGPKKP